MRVFGKSAIAELAAQVEGNIALKLGYLVLLVN